MRILQEIRRNTQAKTPSPAAVTVGSLTNCLHIFGLHYKFLINKIFHKGSIASHNDHQLLIA